MTTGLFYRGIKGVILRASNSIANRNYVTTNSLLQNSQEPKTGEMSQRGAENGLYFLEKITSSNKNEELNGSEDKPSTRISQNGIDNMRTYLQGTKRNQENER